jgi:xanthosine utilization system XapX-like protein
MSMMGGRFSQGPDEVGQTIASFPSYDRAQKAVSSLIAGDVPARDIAIVGQGLRSVERITGRLGYATAARSGAINGVLLGLLFSAILVIGSPSVPIQAFVGVLFVGIAVGMLLSIITYSLVRRRRDYASVTQVIADHYEVTVAPASAARARQIIGSGAAAAPRAETTPAYEPPRYGERVVPGEGQAASGSTAEDSGARHTPAPDAGEDDEQRTTPDPGERRDGPSVT